MSFLLFSFKFAQLSIRYRVISAVDFLREINAREAYDFKGDVVVIGGGNVAIDCSRDAVRAGTEHVYQYSLETQETMPASADEIEEALEDGVVLNGGWGPKEILRDDSGAVNGIVLKRCVSVKDKEGRFRPQYDENETVTVPCATVVLAVGQSIVWGDLLKGTNVKLGGGMGALCDPVTYQTDQPDIFAGGDVYTGPKFVIDAIAAGKEAAESLHRYVWEGHSLTLGRVRRDNFKYIDKSNVLIPLSGYDSAKRNTHGVDESKVKTFRDERLPFPALEQAVSSEAETGSERPAVLVADDEPISLEGAVSLLRATLTGADVTGFTKPSDVLAFARKKPVALAFLDIELGRTSGLLLCEELLKIHPKTNVIFLTAYADYALDAWSTGASGFAVKPLTADMIRAQLSRLRYPVGGLVR